MLPVGWNEKMTVVMNYWSLVLVPRPPLKDPLLRGEAAAPFRSKVEFQKDSGHFFFFFSVFLFFFDEVLVSILMFFSVGAVFTATLVAPSGWQQHCTTINP